MNKVLLVLFTSSFFARIALCMSTQIATQPDPLKQTVRHTTTKEFQSHIEKNLFSLTNSRSQIEANTTLHELAYPFTDAELEMYNVKHKTQYTKQQIAQFHAYKVDLVLRQDNAHKALIKINNNYLTPGLLAAENGYLPVMARMMLSNPSDWALMIFNLAPEHKQTLIKSFLNYTQSPTRLELPEDLKVTLTEKQFNHLEQWASKPFEDQPDSWAQLNREQTKYLFECYLALDIRKQYEANPNHPIAKAALKKLL